jgi:excisionase family DNA binding protein
MKTTEMTDLENPDPLLTMSQAAKYLGISKSTMYELARAKKLKIVRLTADARVRQSTLDDFIKSHETTWHWSWGASCVHWEGAE